MKATENTRWRVPVFTLVFLLAFGAGLIPAGCRLDSGSGPSSAVTGTIPDVPLDVTATALETNVKLSWSSVTGADGYYVYRSLRDAGSYSREGNTSSTSYESTGLSKGTTYYYRVSAWNNAGEGSYSLSASATTVPTTPTGVSAATVSSSSIRVTWSPVSGATGYRVFSSTSYNGSYGLLGSTSSATYTNTRLSADTAYYYKVSAWNSAGESPLSSYVWDTTLPELIPGEE